MVCQRFHKGGKICSWDDKERYEVELGREIVENIWGFEEVYNGASFNNIRLG